MIWRDCASDKSENNAYLQKAEKFAIREFKPKILPLIKETFVVPFSTETIVLSTIPPNRGVRVYTQGRLRFDSSVSQISNYACRTAELTGANFTGPVELAALIEIWQEEWSPNDNNWNPIHERTEIHPELSYAPEPQKRRLMARLHLMFANSSGHTEHYAGGDEKTIIENKIRICPYKIYDAYGRAAFDKQNKPLYKDQITISVEQN
jgi:hypothetical protein